MKRILFLGLIALMGINANAQRWGTSSNRDNTGRVTTYKELTPAYSATVTVAPKASYTYIKPATLTGALTVVADETNVKKYDELTFIFTADGTNRVVTFSTNLVTAGTLTVTASKQATTKFVYDGTNFVETSRAVEP